MERKVAKGEGRLGVVSPPERSAGGLTTPAARAIPDPEVPARARRRRFTREYKLSVLQRADACKEPGEIGALLRREGLYSSHLTVWRRQRSDGTLGTKRRGPKSTKPDPHTVELERENRRLRRQLEKAKMVIEIQRKVSSLLGIPLKPPRRDGSD